MNSRTLLVAGLIGAPLLAQEVDLRIEKSKAPIEYTIESRSAVETQREMLFDGEARDFGGRGGGGAGGPTTIEQKVVFVEAQNEDGTTSRTYAAAVAKVERPGRDGETQSNEIQGGMLGKELIVFEDDRGVVVQPSDADDPLPQNAARGVPLLVSFAGVMPTEKVAVGAEFELGKAFQKALAGLSHPVRPEQAAGGRGARGGRGQGGEGAEGADRGRGGRGEGGEGAERGRGGRGQGGEGAQRGGQRGQRGGFAGRNARGVSDQALALLTNGNLKTNVIGKLVSVEEGIAKIELSGELTAKGDPAELGIGGGGMFGGRGGRGGRGGGAQMEGEGSAKVAIEGALWIDTGAHQITKLVIEGNAHSHVNQIGTMRESEIEIDTTTEGKFRVALTAAPKQ